MRSILVTCAIWMLASPAWCVAEETKPDTRKIVETEWGAYVDALQPVAGDLVDMLHDVDDEQLRHELYEFIFSQLAAGYLAVFHADPKHPDFWPMFNNAFDQLFPNPDGSYYVAPIDDDGVYKISGFRGTTRIVNLQLGGGELMRGGTGTLGATLANYDVDDLSLGADGSFEVILSPTRPADFDGDWRQLVKGATYVLVRQFSYDWLNEVDARVAIDRLDTPAAVPRASAADLQARLKQNIAWAVNWVSTSRALSNRSRQAHAIPNRFIVNDFAEVGGFSTQRYIEGRFELADDEALVVETDVPETCRYWMFQMADEWWRAIDEFRQTSINGHTAKLDSDGKLRFVVSAQDPGVPNWLDTVGRNRGFVEGRWNDCSSGPTPKAKRVPVAEVREHLPEHTPDVTAEQREEQIRLRRKGIQLRRRW